MNFKKIISGLAAGTVAAALSVSAFAAAPTVIWSNGDSLVQSSNRALESIGILSSIISEETTAKATFEFDLLLKGENNSQGNNPSSLAFMSGDNEALNISRNGWGSAAYTIGTNDAIDSDNNNGSTASHFVVEFDFDKNSYTATTKNPSGNTKTVTDEFTATSIDSLKLDVKATTKNNQATISNLTITTEDKATEPTAVEATKVSPELIEGETTKDAVGFKATIPAQSTAGKVVWNVKKDASSDAVTVDGGATEVTGTEIIVGLLITDVPADADVDGMAATVTVE